MSWMWQSKMRRSSLGAAASALMLMSAVSVFAQDVTSVTELDLDTGGAYAYFAAPDGQHLLYTPSGDPDQLALLNLVDGSTVMIPVPQEGGFPVRVPNYSRSLFTAIRWSPDSTKFVFSGTDFITFREGDLWIYDLASETWTNTTDDGYDGRAMNSALLRDELEEDQPFMIESQPSWSPDGRSIAFERTVIPESDQQTSTISILDVETGAIRDVIELPKAEADSPVMGTTVGLEWSPDGKILYVDILGVRPDFLIDGLYQLDIETGTLQKLLTPGRLGDVLKDFAGQTEDPPRLITPIRVSPTGEHILLWLGDYTRFPALYWPFVYDLESRSLTPVVPYIPASDGPMQILVPQHVAWSPDGTQVLTLSRVYERAEIDAAELLPVDGTSILLGSYTIAEGAYETFGLLPGIPATPMMGEWSETGHAVLGAFWFTLE